MKNAYFVLLKGIGVRMVDGLGQGAFAEVNTIFLESLQNHKFKGGFAEIVMFYLNRCTQGSCCTRIGTQRRPLVYNSESKIAKSSWNDLNSR